jgi:GH18 family chitinase
MSTRRYKSIVYHADWANYARNFQVANLAASLPGITDVAYAFFNIQDSGGGNYVIIPGDLYSL